MSGIKGPVTDAIFVSHRLQDDPAGSPRHQDLESQARQLASRKEGKPGRTARVFTSAAELGGFLADADSRTLRKMHILAHGNTQLVGNQTRDDLAAFLRDNLHAAEHPDLQKVTLHACESGTPGPDGAASVAEYVANNLKPELNGLRIGGYNGFSHMLGGHLRGKNFALPIPVPPGKDVDEVLFVHTNRLPRPVFLAGDTAGNEATRHSNATEIADRKAGIAERHRQDAAARAEYIRSRFGTARPDRDDGWRRHSDFALTATLQHRAAHSKDPRNSFLISGQD